MMMMEESQASAQTGAEHPASPPADPTTFEAMGLHPDVARAVAEMGFAQPMQVQRVTWPRAMAGRDLLVQSRTGSGKTAAFAIPFAQGLVDASRPGVQALVLCPTREL